LDLFWGTFWACHPHNRMVSGPSWVRPLKVPSHLVLGTLVFESTNIMLVILDLNLFTMKKFLC
jgi:hypothetical protein